MLTGGLMQNEPKTTFIVQDRFDPDKKRFYINDFPIVLHSHHYAVLVTQLADDAMSFKGVQHLQKAAEDTFYEVLKAYFDDHGIGLIGDRIALAEQYWAYVGMGNITFSVVEKQCVIAEMQSSHVDNGWIDKIKSWKQPVNFITAGYVAAVSALVTGHPTRSFIVKEIRSIVRGDPVSVFKAILD